MATLASFISGSLLHRQPSGSSGDLLLRSFSVRLPTKLRTGVYGSSRILTLARSSSSSFDGESRSQSKNSVLTDLIREIEPLDVNLIQKDVSPTTLDAMKRTISGMLGLLPSDQFQVLIEALWQPLSKLLISSMMTGYTLRNAEYRLYIEENLEIYGGNVDKQKLDDCKSEAEELLLNDYGIEGISILDKLPMSKKISESTSPLPDFGDVNSKTKQYILNLQSHLSSVKKELLEVKRKNTALQMQQFVGEEKNDLLDYLRSLQPEKVAELSEPTSPELKETIHSVVHGLLATLSPKMNSRAPDIPEDASTGIMNIGDREDCMDLLENTSLQFQPHISLTRDYLARLLFWCMLMGHYLRGLEYRSELTELLSLPCALENKTPGEQAA